MSQLMHFSRLPVASILTPTSIDLTAMAQDQAALDSLDLTSDKYFCWKFSQVSLPVSEGTIVAEPVSTSTPQMIYKVKRVSNDSQKTMKETKAR